MNAKFYSIISLMLIVFSSGLRKNAPSPINIDQKQNYLSGAFCSSNINDAIAWLDSINQPAPLFPDMGNHHYQVHTIAPLAQKYFDQGLNLVYGFNHGEAYRSFKECLKIDPYCSMAYWGIAMALGPNLNDWAPSNQREQEAYEALQSAKAILTPGKEQDLIEALMTRHADSTQVNRDSLNNNYYLAMEKLVSKYPDDLEIKTLFVDAIMNTMPWDYYEKDLRAKSLTYDAVAMLEEIITKNPYHPGAHHLYIHVVEASDNPDRGIASADRLGTLVPAAGHLVHMPAHIYARVGRYEDAAECNRKAILADENYLASCQAQGVYPMGYYPHNIHFLWMASTLSGQKSEALDAAEKVADKIPSKEAINDLNAQQFLAVPLQAYVRFGQWNQILTTPKPDKELQLVNIYWRHARSIAFAKKGLLAKAQTELDSLQALVVLEKSKGESDSITQDTGYDLYEDMYSLLHLIPSAELAVAKGDFTDAINDLERAVESEDKLPYNEPPYWHHPVRQILGNVQLLAGNFPEAQQTFQEDLKKNRDNGWSLFGLYQCMEKSGKTAEAKETYKAYRKAWIHADFELTAAAF